MQTRLNRYIDQMKGQRVAVIGAGISNTPLIALLAKRGIDVTVCDKRNLDAMGETGAQLNRLGVKWQLGEHYLENLDFDVIFRTPGLHPDKLKNAASALITSEMEAFFQLCPCKIIGVTGSDGKTTTTTLIAELLKRAGYTVHIGGNIGHPLLCDIPKMKRHDFAVLELSSFQLMTMKKSPHIAVVTNVAPNHLDVHNSMEEYINAKRAIFRYQSLHDRLITNADNEITLRFAEEADSRVTLFSRKAKLEEGIYFDGESIRRANCGKDMELCKASDILLPGLHNIENYMAAFAAVEDYVSPDVCRQLAREFAGVEHRIELVRKLDGVSYYNDSIASSPTRTTAALHAFTQKLILIAGGYDKHIPFTLLGPEICSHVKILILTGATAQAIRSSVESAENYTSGVPEILETDDFTEAVCLARQKALPGDVVILSPACASFDRFKNFEERGRLFKDIVNAF